MKQNDFDKIIEHRKFTDKIIHTPDSISEIEEVLNTLSFERKDHLLAIMSQEGIEMFNNILSELREEYYKLNYIKSESNMQK